MKVNLQKTQIQFQNIQEFFFCEDTKTLKRKKNLYAGNFNSNLCKEKYYFNT